MQLNLLTVHLTLARLVTTASTVMGLFVVINLPTSLETAINVQYAMTPTFVLVARLAHLISITKLTLLASLKPWFVA